MTIYTSMDTILTDTLIAQAVDAILASHDARHGDYWLDAYDYNPALAVQQCSTVTDSLLEGLLSSLTDVIRNRATKLA